MYSYLAGGYFVKILRLFTMCFNRITDFTFSAICGSQSRPLPPITSPILTESAIDLSRKIRLRELSSQAVVSAFISRIKEVNGILNAVVDERFEAALEEARRVDEFLSAVTKEDDVVEQLAQEKPFLGVPFTIKENFQAKGLKHSGGLVARKDIIATTDAEVIVAMKNAGAILLGVTNLSELCAWWESRNNVYGQTSNPYNTKRTAGGSSGGEGAIISAAGSVMGVGSDIGGSVRMPAFFVGIYGHKPSESQCEGKSIVSNYGQLPCVEGDLMSFLCTGPLCRYAKDLLPMLRVMAGPGAIQMLKLDEPVNIRALKIYYMEDDGGFPLVSSVSNELRSVQKKVVQYFERVHGVKSQKVFISEMERSLEIWGARICMSASPKFSEELVQRKGKLNVYAELLRWCVCRSDHTFPAIVAGLLENCGDFMVNKKEVYSMCCTMKKKFDEMLGDNGIFLYPSFPTTAPFHYQAFFEPFNFSYQSIFNVLGLPVTQCPLGLSSQDRLPVGIQVVAGVGNDRLCLAMAQELEKGFGGWVPPCNIVF